MPSVGPLSVDMSADDASGEGVQSESALSPRAFSPSEILAYSPTSSRDVTRRMLMQKREARRVAQELAKRNRVRLV